MAKSKNNHTEVEVRFLEIDVDQLKRRLNELGADDKGEELLKETIYSDEAGEWPAKQTRIRIRTSSQGVKLAYKEHHADSATGTTEIEFEIGDAEKCAAFLEKMHVILWRTQEKKRHTFQLRGVTIDIDTWPRVPTYVELEGSSEEDLRDVAKKLGLDWEKVIMENAQRVIEKYYHIPLSKMKYFTFDKTSDY